MVHSTPQMFRRVLCKEPDLPLIFLIDSSTNAGGDIEWVEVYKQIERSTQESRWENAEISQDEKTQSKRKSSFEQYPAWRNRMELHFLGRTKNTDMGSSDIFQVNIAPALSGGPYALEK